MIATESFDDIIVGGGSAGAVLAARLSEDPHRRVLLLEAGPDYASVDALPAALRGANAAVMTGHNWDFTARTRERDKIPELARAAGAFVASGRDAWAAAKAVASAPKWFQTMPYVLGKVIGGSSSVNAALALRPRLSDFDAWVACAGPDWSWDEVLPHLRQLENDVDFGAADPTLHGSTGPIPIERWRSEELEPVQRAFLAACREHGLPHLNDLNGAAGTGAGMVPTNATGDLRVSSAVSHLMPARARPNLRVLGGRLVDHLLFSGRRVAGVHAWHEGQRERYHARRVTVCAGAINTPALLLRSGVGDALACRELRVRSVAHLPGVGRNLCDHPAIMLWLVPAHELHDAGAPQHQVMARVTGDGGASDLNLYCVSGFATRNLPLLARMLPGVVHAISVSLARPASRGNVTIRSADPTVAPQIDLNLGSAPEDITRLMDGVRLAWTLARAPAMAAQARSVFMWTDALMRNPASLRNAVLSVVNGTWHAAGTARMGRHGDPDAVVDARFRVHGTENLRVVDASVMPALPSGPTNLTCMMLAERAAGWMVQDDNGG